MKSPTTLSLFWCSLSVLLAFIASSALPLVDISYTHEPALWFPLVNGLSNSYHSWRIDPLLSTLLSLRGQTAASDGVPLSISVFTLGTGLLARRIRPALRHTPATLWLGAAFSTLSAALIVGRDSAAFGTLAWIPLFSTVLGAGITAARRGLLGAAAPLWVALLFTAVQNSHSANQLSVMSTVCSLLIALSLTKDEPATSRHAALGYCLIFILGVLPALYTTATAPLAPFPDYPASAHLVPDDGVPGLAQPNVGAEYPLATINRTQLKERFAPWSVVLFLANVFFLATLGSRAEDKTTQFFLRTGMTLAVVLLCDTLLPETFSLISPLLSISRSIPSAALIGLTPINTGACVWFTSLAALLCASRASLAALGCYLFISFCVFFFQFQPSLASLLPASDFLDRVRAASNTTSSLRTVLISPSLYARQHFDPFLTSITKSPSNIRLLTVAATIPVQPNSTSFESVPPNPTDSFHRLMDGMRSTRWSPRSGGQRSGDTLLIKFHAPTEVAGLELETGDFPTDYPRGLRVEATASCDKTEIGEATFIAPSWQGSLRFTAAGHPYFSGQEIVRVIFPKSIFSTCIRITQTENSSAFDWSVAEIGVITPLLPENTSPLTALPATKTDAP